VSRPFWRTGVEDLYLPGIRVPGDQGGRSRETRSLDSRNRERRSKSTGTSGTGRSRKKSRETRSLGSRIPENIVTVHKEDTWQRSRFRGNPRKEHFGISATGNAKGKSSGLLTHEILKGSEPSDQGRLTAVDLPQEWSFGISEFGTSVFRIPEVRRVRNWSSRIHEVRNAKSRKGVREGLPGYFGFRHIEGQRTDGVPASRSPEEIPKRRSRRIGARIFRVSAY
jgi:hypothetical protein